MRSLVCRTRTLVCFSATVLFAALATPMKAQHHHTTSSSLSVPSGDGMTRQTTTEGALAPLLSCSQGSDGQSEAEVALAIDNLLPHTVLGLCFVVSGKLNGYCLGYGQFLRCVTGYDPFQCPVGAKPIHSVTTLCNRNVIDSRRQCRFDICCPHSQPDGDWVPSDPGSTP